MAYPSTLVRTKNWGTETLTDADLEGQLDLIIDWVNAVSDSSSGHKHDGTTSEGPKLSLTAAMSGVLPIANGGTGESTLAAFLNLVYPVGSVYANTAVSTNPATLLGFGTWVAIEGQCVVGLVSGGEFDTLGAVSEGATTVKLTGGESGTSAHTHGFKADKDSAGGATNNNYAASTDSSATTDSTNSLSVQASSEANADDSHNNIQPSYVAYVWRRTV